MPSAGDAAEKIATVENALADLEIDDSKQFSLKDIQQLRCTSNKVCELVERYAKVLKRAKNLDLVRLIDGKCWWYSDMEGKGDNDCQRWDCREWTEGLRYLYGIQSKIIKIESKVTNELMLSLQQSRLTCDTLVLRGGHEPSTVQELLSVLRPSSLFFENQQVVDLTDVALKGIKKLRLDETDSVVGLNVITDTRTVSSIVTSTPVTDKELNKLIREWLRNQRKIDSMVFEKVYGKGEKPFSNDLIFLGVDKKRFTVNFDLDIPFPAPLFLVERTDTEALLIITGEGGKITILGPSDNSCQYYQKEMKNIPWDLPRAEVGMNTTDADTEGNSLTH